MRHVVPASLILTGLVHLLPARAVLGREPLGQLYGLDVDEPAAELLLRHRAVLFGLLGASLVGAAFRPALHGAALGAGLISAGTFVLLARVVGPTNDRIARIAQVDIGLVATLLLGAAVHLAGGT